MIYYVKSEDGHSYIVGNWRDGTWIGGTREDAVREARLLRAEEPTAYAWGIERRDRSS